MVQPPQAHNHGKIWQQWERETPDSMMMIRWVMNISSRSPKLHRASLTHTNPHIARKTRKVRVIDVFYGWYDCHGFNVMKYRSWWRHQRETFCALLALCAGNSPVTGEFPSQRPVTRSFDVSLICAWINDWVNNREASYLRRHRAHYDVIVMDHGHHFSVTNVTSAVLLWGA